MQGQITQIITIILFIMIRELASILDQQQPDYLNHNLILIIRVIKINIQHLPNVVNTM